MLKFEAIYGEDKNKDRPLDICAILDTRRIQMLGSKGQVREEAALDPLKKEDPTKVLPVLLGAGLGYALGWLKSHFQGPFAVVEKETELQALTKSLKDLNKDSEQDICCLTDPDCTKVLNNLTRWQAKHQGKKLFPIVLPFYQRIDQGYYGELRKNLEASASFDFWSKAVQPRFVTNEPRVLLLTSKYFLMGEVVAACQKMNLAHKLITIQDDIGHDIFVRQVL
ncbi:MAG: hypothetical protein IJU40_08600, partial [Desulfovibrionaceae bacterium]|nr:hypothetical protein [Desulfovibrionaceae bacterium]